MVPLKSKKKTADSSAKNKTKNNIIIIFAQNSVPIIPA